MIPSRPTMAISHTWAIVVITTHRGQATIYKYANGFFRLVLAVEFRGRSSSMGRGAGCKRPNSSAATVRKGSILHRISGDVRRESLLCDRFVPLS